MDLGTIIPIVTSIAIALIGMCIRTYVVIMGKITKMETALVTKLSHDEARLLIDDKLEPTKVELDNISRRIAEVRFEVTNNNLKLDKILELVSKR